ncbi:hypothetical protein VITFI_CDS2744 [Vitreoscilla filiformis]|uniref:Uncharacterized protein n=1 Tax=Vitreoscilla filiformis TaxID=63 RepID=A0A221KHK4_VITFI|nr:hypothetical protein VITFI_CDS2744 [Vitreoscilla filiformis]
MGHIAVVGTVNGGDILERVEVSAPVLRHRGGVVEVGLVHLFDIRGIAAEQIRVRRVLLHHLSLTFCFGFRSSDGLSNLPRPGSTGWRIARSALLLLSHNQQGDTEGAQSSRAATVTPL